jgi:hypothetical protein
MVDLHTKTELIPGLPITWPFLLVVSWSVFAILVFWDFRDEQRSISILAETLDQERAQVPLWGPALVSGATFYGLG